MGRKIPSNEETPQHWDYWGYDQVTLTPQVLYGEPLSLKYSFDETGALNWRPYDIDLLNRILKEAYLIEPVPKQWCYSYLCDRQNLGIHYAYPAPNDRLFYTCRNSDMPLCIRADSRLVGIAATIMYRYYLIANSKTAEESSFHEAMGRLLREYCYYHGACRSYQPYDFTDDLFELLLVDFPVISYD